MTKLVATFEEVHADGVVEELSRLGIKDVDWQVYQASNRTGSGDGDAGSRTADGMAGAGGAAGP